MGDISYWLARSVPGFTMPPVTFPVTLATIGKGRVFHIQGHGGCRQIRNAAPSKLVEHVFDADRVDEGTLCPKCYDPNKSRFADLAFRRFHPVGVEGFDIAHVIDVMEYATSKLSETSTSASLIEALDAVARAEPAVRLLAGQTDALSVAMAAEARTQIGRIREIAAAAASVDRSIAAVMPALAPAYGDQSGFFKGMWFIADDYVSAAPDLCKAVAQRCSSDLGAACRGAVGARILSELAQYNGPKLLLERTPYRLLVETLEPVGDESVRVLLSEQAPADRTRLVEMLVEHDAGILERWIRNRFTAAYTTPLATAAFAGTPNHVTRLTAMLAWPIEGLDHATLHVDDYHDKPGGMVFVGPRDLVEALIAYTAFHERGTVRSAMVPHARFGAAELAPVLAATAESLSETPDRWLETALSIVDDA